MGLAPCLAALGGLLLISGIFQSPFLPKPSVTFSNQMVALGCADGGFNVVPRRVELLFRE